MGNAIFPIVWPFMAPTHRHFRVGQGERRHDWPLCYVGTFLNYLYLISSLLVPLRTRHLIVFYPFIVDFIWTRPIMKSQFAGHRWDCAPPFSNWNGKHPSPEHQFTLTVPFWVFYAARLFIAVWILFLQAVFRRHRAVLGQSALTSIQLKLIGEI